MQEVLTKSKETDMGCVHGGGKKRHSLVMQGENTSHKKTNCRV